MKNVFCAPCDNHGLQPMDFKKTLICEKTEAACNYLGIKPDVIFGKGRQRPIVEKRYMVMSYLSVSMNLRLTEIGKHFNKDHSTVIYGKKVVSDLCTTDPRFNDTYNSMTKYLNEI